MSRVLGTLRARVLVGAVVFGCAAGVVGCAEDSSPEEESTAESSPAEEEQDEPEAEDTPSIEDQQDEAIEAVREWVLASNEARRTLDPEPMLALSGPDCRSCEFYAEDLRSLKDDGGNYQGDFEEEFIGAEPKDPSKVSPLVVTVHSGSWQTVDGDGKIQINAEAEEYTSEYQMTREDGEWVVSGIGEE